ncbi:SDR family NAD(P)-dependent oxidoreductase [Homoserinibacter sp. YIM 151385]|uniref:SDR family NAD(P)-dependent oxidoreductase n=1 Tax=Homoserinibacter sp. YIM 151385 TaxID=2985506 RepID=UPI0022F00B9A|nr:SDR family NAD(P)-dependent oxidoreductase [Homoserinibacter sp. YIM 151385]WBU38810.1 SDR family NAD(P)-dependent oxidoreductase [Homoserinibacter sp. YIM 151385]
MRYEATTALVTGASSGIGAEFAGRLARRGADIVAVARRLEELDSLAERIRAETGRRVHVVPFDLSQERAGYRLAEQLAGVGLRVDTVVNCAGVGVTRVFGDSTEEQLRRQLRVNIDATVEISHAFLPQLIASGVGALINVGSMTGYMPVPGMAVYAAAKSFVVHFTEALAHEVRASGVTVMAVSPGPTATAFYSTSGTTEKGVRFQTPDQVVTTALDALQRKNPPVSVISGTRNRWTKRLVGVLPVRTVLRAAEIRPADS